MSIKPILRYDIKLMPLMERLQSAEILRASRARKESKKKVKTIKPHFVSVNAMYPVARDRGVKYLSREGEIYKDYIDEMMRATDHARAALPLFECYECSYIFYFTHEMLYSKKGDFLEKDVSNCLKAAEDAVFGYLQESDSLVLSIAGYKRLSLENPKLVVLLSPADITDDVFHGGGRFNAYDLEVA